MVIPLLANQDLAPMLVKSALYSDFILKKHVIIVLQV